MKSPINNDNLDQLFNKAKADKQDLDDFEKDALGGFDMLESEQEARDLKSALDERITKELFKEEKKNPKIYWLAAAGLALVIGLSTLFILNNSNSVLKSGDLAITTTEKDIQKDILPESEKVLKEEAAPPMEQAVTKADEASPKAIAAAKDEDRLKDREETKNVKDAEEPVKGATPRMVLKSPASKGPTDVPNFESEKSTGKKDADKNPELSNSRSNNAPALDDLAKNKSTKDKESDDFKAQIATAKPAQETSLSQSEVNVNDESNYKTEKSEDKKSNEESNLLTNSVAANTSSSYRERKQEHNKAKKQSTDQQQSAGLAGSTSDNKPGTPASTTKAAGDISTDKRDDNTFVNCYYSGGEAEIIKDIKEKLTPANLNQKFDATLYINEKKVVNKVEFTNTYDLNQKQKEEVTKILKSLNKFNFFMAPTSKSEYSYKVIYRP